MALDKNRYYAALTGDAIKSSKLDAEGRGRLHDGILAAGEDLQASFEGLVVGGTNVFRGDSVQFLVNDPGRSLRAALFFRAALKSAAGSIKADMRLAIGVGGIDFMPEVSKGGADGEAFRLSGPALDSMGAKQSLRLAVPENWPPVYVEALKTTIVLVGALADGWTEKQALAVKGALLGQTQDEISRSWPQPVSRQAVAKSLDGANWFAVERALKFFEKNWFGQKQ